MRHSMACPRKWMSPWDSRRLTHGDEDLLPDEVHACHLLSHGVFDWMRLTSRK
jgi:hypothetical protein